MIPVFTLAARVKNLFYANGQPVGKAEEHTIYAADAAHPEIGKKLYAGEFDNNKLEAAITAFNAQPAKPAKAPSKPASKKKANRSASIEAKPDLQAKAKAR